MKLEKDKILKELKQKGVVIVDSFISVEELKNLETEFHKFLSYENPGCSFTPYSEGKCTRVKRDEYIKSDFPSTTTFFYSDIFRELAERYMGGKVSLNEELFVVRDVVGSKHIANDLHYDILRTFKFFIYITDTTRENGAFTCVPGSHKKTAEYRKAFSDKISYKNRDVSRELDLNEFDPAIAIEGKAGSLIMFDTDVWHQAGIVSKGERHVMRGHTRVLDTNSNNNLFSKIKNKLFGK